jgi:hypothetical protein
MAKFYPLSPSSLNAFQTCPRMFQGQYITKEVPYVESPEQRAGNLEHSAFEERIKDQKPFPKEYERHEWIGERIDKLRDHAEVFAELKLAVDRNFQPCRYNDYDHRYMLCKIDFLAVRAPRAVICDWKSGKPKSNVQQLVFNGKLVFDHYPEIQRADGGLVFTNANMLVPFSLTRNSPQLDELRRDCEHYEASLEHDDFRPTPNGLCAKYCRVHSCPHNGHRA